MSAVPMAARGFRRRGAELLGVECWCGATIVHVTAEVIRACLTESCGAPGCEPPEEAA